MSFLPFSSILMLDNIMEDGLTLLTLGTLYVRHNKLLHKVSVLVELLSLAHKQRNKLWQVLLMLLAWQIQRILKICFHLHSSQHSSKHNNEVTLMTFHSSVELIKQAFNAYVVQSEKCV